MLPVHSLLEGWLRPWLWLLTSEPSVFCSARCLMELIQITGQLQKLHPVAHQC